ncbi:D-Ala-D-Ala carboxypeptidase family metallohydrolase [Novosphingobium sp. Gsoil 351]|uniref:D-Ala-D-Ala carboxypeptidase family metallohydrolase n=1 Tax=Novosphingobium sp. Gsoil 351 TaxID=2675225 RepID=UPI0012B4C41F|nr:D-Ala-D-Ala carboxypeptidase family metallohydrolase [Novosphingobium sp. Gsoil 351]QGN56177.1 hypothetical protein GKE62_18110 [Novosphingobium sp. Gsoil 351]
MPRAPNFHYQDPTAAIGSSLVRAIFGDPQAAAQQAQERAKADALAAQAEENRAHARVYGSQATVLDTANAAQQGLPELIARLQAPPQAVPSLDDPTFLDGVGTRPPVPTDDEQFRSNLGPLIASMAQMNGDKVDPTKIVGSLASFFGGDEMARRGLIAQGNTPGAAFAITPERADEIAAQGYDAKNKTALGVATINNRDDVPVANIQAGSSRYAADSSARASNFRTVTTSGDRRYAVDAKSVGPAPSFDTIAQSFPGTKMNSGWRSVEHNRAVGGVENSDHLGNKPGVQGYDFDPIPGCTVEQAAAKYERDHPGIRVIDARDERGKRGPNGKPLGGWHFSLQNTVAPAKPGKGGAAAAAADKPPKRMTSKEQDMVDEEVKNQLEVSGLNPTDAMKTSIRAGAAYNFQRSGNAVDAVANSIKAHKQRGAWQKQEAARSAASGNRLSVEEAARLPVGARFVGMDGAPRVRQ